MTEAGAHEPQPVEPTREKHIMTTETPRPVEASADEPSEPAARDGAIQMLLDKILSVGVDGLGPMKGARQVAEEHLAAHPDVEDAVARIIATHVRLAAATGFATGMGGLLTLPVTIPADAAVFYVLAGRCAAAVAHARGYDVTADEVRSVILISLLGAGGTALLADVGVTIGNKAAMSALKSLPGSAVFAINKRVGFRLLTKFGSTGVINLVRVIPLVGGGTGAVVNAGSMRGIGRYAGKNFPARVQVGGSATT